MIKTISSAGIVAAIALLNCHNASAATIDQTFTQSYQCNSVKFRAQTGVTQQQLIRSCNEISETETAFHNFFNSNPNSPLPNDNNDTLDVYIYLSSAEYKANGNAHFGINTDNGGMYLEGTPSNTTNQAKFIAHICEDSWVPYSCSYTGQVYNLQHEFTHYLDGRYNVSGAFGTFSYNAALTEGLADYLAQGTNYTRTLTGLAGKTIPPLYNILSANYYLEDLYKWGYMAIHYMHANHRSDYDAIISALRSGNTTTFRNTIKDVADRIGGGFDAYVKSLTTAVAIVPGTEPADNTFGLCNLEHMYARDVRETATSNLSITNYSSVPMRMMWISNTTGFAAVDEIARLTQGQNYNNNYWRKGDRFMMMSDNRECVGVGIVGQTATFSIDSSLVANVVPDVLPAANEIGECSLERPYFKSDTVTNVSVTNNTTDTMEVRWVNYVTGVRSDTVYATLGAGQSYTGTTWKAGDRMIFVDSTNTCKGVVSLNAGTNTYYIDNAVQNVAPTAKVNGAYTGTEDTTVNFSSAGSSDSDGSIVSYNWNFGDGTTSTLANPSHTYALANTYTVSLTVTDNEGASKTATTTATITADVVTPPVTNVPDACATENAITGGNLTAGDATCLGNSSVIWLGIANISGHDSVTIRTGNGSGNLNLRYDNTSWPNGTSSDDGISDNAGNSECIHVAGGTNYWGNVKVANSNGTASILVEFDGAGCSGNTGGNQNTAPTANVNGAYSGTANTAVNFSSAGSTDFEGPISAYNWNFGDGSISTLANPSHTYTVANTYNVTLTVTDNDGATATATTTATIQAEQTGGGNSSVANACLTEGSTSGWVNANDDMCVPSGSWNNAIAYYGINVPAGTNSVVITADHGTGNGNLYYKATGWATNTSFDQKSENAGNTESITINNPGSGYRYFSIVGQQTGMAVKFEFH